MVVLPSRYLLEVFLLPTSNRTHQSLILTPFTWPLSVTLVKRQAHLEHEYRNKQSEDYLCFLRATSFAGLPNSFICPTINDDDTTAL
jgi:hypothetical protein